MNLLIGRIRAAWKVVIPALFAVFISAACNAGFIALINRALHTASLSSSPLIWGFIGLALTKLLSSGFSRILLAKFSQQMIAEVRQGLCSKILAAPLQHLESIGTARLQAALTEDVQAIRNGSQQLSGLVVNLSILIGCSVYLCLLSVKVFLLICGFIVLGIGAYQILAKSAMRYLRLARQEQDAMFSHFRSLTEGIKELKLHRKRLDAFLDEALHPTIALIRHTNMDAYSRFVGAQSCSMLFFYAMIGALLFVLPTMTDTDTELLTGYVLTAVYLFAPLGQVLSSFPILSRAKIAFQKIDELGLSLASNPVEVEFRDNLSPANEWHTLELENLVYTYDQGSGKNPFTLGPIDLCLRPGELTIWSGGNGSGKSTLARIITGLYVPKQGGIYLDKRPITDENRHWYRQYFSAVFSEFHLFESLYGLERSDLKERVQDYLTRFQIDDKVEFEDGAFSTTNLSTGQRKRLALITAYLENRPIYVFDECAADQDAEFKAIFYTKLLPELKSQGKAIIVISHDDRYFHLADNIVKFEEGRLVA